MKPDWKDAPEWAMWLAKDGDGCWYWYERQPHYVYDGSWTTGGKGRIECAGESELECEARPS